MKRKLIYIFALVIYATMASSQNFLPLEWKISFANKDLSIHTNKELDTWKDVNLLLSWERQGYSSSQGFCCLATDFNVGKNFADSDMVLKVGLQCFISEIYINDNYIGGNLPDFFQTHRDTLIEFAVPNKYLFKDKKNRIEIYASELSYTGGISHNSCTLGPAVATNTPEVKIFIPQANHVFTNNSPELKIRYKVSQKSKLNLRIKNDFHEMIADKSFDINPSDSVLNVKLKDNVTEPGFYECMALIDDTCHSGDVQWFTLSPEKTKCKNETVSGFDSYWENTISELKNINPDFKIHKVDSLCTKTRDGYIIEMKSLGDLTIRGYYFVPRTEGRHAVIMHVPGYGWGYEDLTYFLKNTENVAELALCVRGHGISADVFNPGFGVPGVWGYKLYSEQENAYRGIYADCVRAIDFLRSRPEIDTTRIGVMGGSQGGGLTLATAGLCKTKIAACAYFDPFPCDIRDLLKIREICQTEVKAFLKYYNNEHSHDQAMHVQDLIDAKGFASWITCPVFFGSSLFDDDCPPHVGFMAYNNIKSPKQYKIYPNDSHLGESNYNKDFLHFFKEQFKF